MGIYSLQHKFSFSKLRSIKMQTQSLIGAQAGLLQKDIAVVKAKASMPWFLCVYLKPSFKLLDNLIF